jgi:hypothetical protein
VQVYGVKYDPVALRGGVMCGDRDETFGELASRKISDAYNFLRHIFYRYTPSEENYADAIDRGRQSEVIAAFADTIAQLELEAITR